MQVVKQAELCDFDNREERIKYKIISSIPKYLMNSIIRLGDQSLATIVKICRESLNSEGSTDYVTEQVVDLVFPTRLTPYKTRVDENKPQRKTKVVEDSFLDL